MAKPRQLSLPDDRKAWHRLKGESEERYEWFRRYLEMSLPRSIKRLAEQHSASAAYLYQLSSTGLWADRCRLYDEDGQTQWDREVLLKQRKTHATITEMAAQLAARCLARAAQVVGELPPDKAVARAFDGARTVHSLTGPQTPTVQVTATAQAAAGAQAGSGEAMAEEDAAYGRDTTLYGDLVEAIRADVRTEIAQQAAPARHHNDPQGGAGPTITPAPQLQALIANLDHEEGGR